MSSIAVRQARLRSARWCALFNGTHLRLVDAALPYSRRFVQFDLDTVADDEGAFAAFSYVMGCLPGSLRSLVDASEQHGIAVCRSLKDGVLSASADVLRALVRPSSSAASPAASFEQALTIVYRMLFLLFAEARGLVPLWHPVYRDSYSVDGAARRCAERTGTRGGSVGRAARDRAARARRLPRRRPARHAVQRPAVRAGAHAARRAPRPGRRGGAAGGAGAVDAPSRRSRRPRAHRVPRPRRRAARRRVRDAARLRAARAAAAPREAAGSTSTSRSTAAPACARRPARSTRRSRSPTTSSAARSARSCATRRPSGSSRLRVVDPAMGSGAFLVAACRYLAQAYEAALVRAGGCHASDIGDARARRHPADDRRAVPLRRRPQPDGRAARAPVALARDARGRSAAHVSRSSSAGRRQPARRVARRASPGRRAPPAPSRARRRDAAAVRRRRRSATRSQDALPVRFSLESMPNDTLEQVRAKERALARAEPARTRRCRGGSASRISGAPAGSSADGRRVPSSAFGALIGRDSDRARRAARRRRGPAICDARGEVAARAAVLSLGARVPGSVLRRGRRAVSRTPGFDAVIGNPPWDMIRADAGAADARERVAARHRAGASLHARLRRLHGAVGRPRQPLSAVRRARDGARRGRADASVSCCRPASATDHGSAPLRRRLLLARATSTRSSASTTSAASSPSTAASGFCSSPRRPARRPAASACRLGERDPAVLETAGDDTPARFAVVSGARHARRCSSASRATTSRFRISARRSTSRSPSARRRCFRRSATNAGGRRASAAS